MTDTVLKAINIQPGIVKDVTEYQAEGRWVDCNHIRWRSGRPEKIGGFAREQVQQSTDAANQLFTGVSRATLTWSDLSFKKYLASGSHLKLELLNDGIIYDITPIRESPSLTDAISTTNTESEVQITDVNHNLSVGDYIFVVSQATAVDGIDLDGEYVVTEVIDADNYKVDSGIAASGTTALAGGALSLQYLLEIGSQSNGNLTGWGGGTWGTEGQSGQGWNRPRNGIGGQNLRQWSLDNWGEDLVACVRQGKIYHWDATNGVTTRAQVLSNAPLQNLFILVAQPSRHLVAFGSEVFITGVFDPLVIRWADQETLNTWDIDVNNTAGEYRLPKGNYIVGAVQTRGEILVFTDTDVYSMRFVGGNEVFRFEHLGSNISTVSAHSFVDVNGIVMWQGLDNFYMYDGVVQSIPCSIEKFVFDQDGDGTLNFSQKEKVYCGVIKEFNEVIWLYPKKDSDECNFYIKYNYEEGVFDFGDFDRTTWIDRGVFDRPYAISASGRLYAHEVGKDADGAPFEAFIRSAYFDIDDGQQLMFVDRILPDIRLAPNRNVEITLFAKKYVHPTATSVQKGPFYFDDSMGKISCRIRGRQISIEYRVTATGADFEVGKVRIGFQPDGGR